MLAREAYIAARSGAPKSARPATGTSKPDGPPGSRTREQKAFDAGQQERQREQSIEARKEAAKKMQQAGLSGVGDISSTTRRGQQAVKDFYKDRGEGIPEVIQNVLKETPEPQQNPIVKTLQDIGIMGPAIKRLSPLQLKQAQNILSSYSPLDVGLLKSFILSRTNPISGLFGKEQLYSDMEGNIIDSTDVEEVGGKLINKKTGEEVRRTKEGIISQLESIDPNIMESLKKFEEADYYNFMGMPGTMGGLEDLGALDATEYAGNADFQNMIYAAREAASRRNPQVQKGGEGIPSFAAAPTPFTDVNNNGILDNLEVAQATTTPVAATPVTAATTLGIPSLTPTTLNYASMAPQFGSQYPGYINQGVMDPNLSPYYDNLRNYYGVV